MIEMKVETEKPELLMNALKLLKTFGIEHILRFEKDRLVCIVADNVASMQNVIISKSLFKVYPEIGDNEFYDICVKIEELTKALKGIKDGTLLKLDFGENLDKIGITYTQKKKCEYELRVIELPTDYNYAGMIKNMNNVNPKNHIVVELSEFMDTMEKLIFNGGASDVPKMILNMTAEGCFVCDKQIEKGRSKIELVPLDKNIKLVDDSVKLTLNKNYITNLLVGLKDITDKVLLQMQSDYPIKMIAVSPLVKVEQLIAPIVEND